MHVMVRKLQERRKLGKSTVFRVRGRIIDEDKIERFARRNKSSDVADRQSKLAFTTLWYIDLSSKKLETPENVEYHTPEELETPTSKDPLRAPNRSTTPIPTIAQPMSVDLCNKPPATQLQPEVNAPAYGPSRESIVSGMTSKSGQYLGDHDSLEGPPLFIWTRPQSSMEIRASDINHNLDFTRAAKPLFLEDNLKYTTMVSQQVSGVNFHIRTLINFSSPRPRCRTLHLITHF